jgi:deoxycytidine triphosphate deaminase
VPSIKSDRWIKKMALEHGMIDPFVETQVRENVISYGLSSYGYDKRLAELVPRWASGTGPWQVPAACA